MMTDADRTYAHVIDEPGDVPSYSVWDKVQGTVVPIGASRLQAHRYRNDLQRMYERRALTGVVTFKRVDEWA